MSKTVIVIHPDYAAAKDYAARLTRDWCWAPDPRVGAVWPEQPSPGWNVTTLRVYRHGQDAVNILCYQEPETELLRAIGEAFRGE